MPKYLVTYHGEGSPPPTPEAQQEAMAAFGAWLASAGEAVIDPGAPFAAARSVSAAGATDGPVAPVAGYTLISAPDFDAAVALLDGHPFIARGGTLQVNEAVSLG